MIYMTCPMLLRPGLKWLKRHDPAEEASACGAPFSRLLWGLSLCLGLMMMGCGREEAPQQQTPPPQTTTVRTNAVLQPVALPSLDGFEDAVRVQIQDQYAQTEALSESQPPDTAALGAAYGTLGMLMLAYELNDAAKPTLLNAAILLPEDMRWPYYLGYYFQQTAQPDSAAPWYERVLALQPDDVPAHVHLAEVYRDQGRTAEAQDLLRKTIERDPQCAPAYFMLGQMADDPAEAIALYERVLELQPGASVVHNALGLAYRDQGNMERSRFHLARRGGTPARLRDLLLQDLERLKESTNAKMYLARRFMAQRMYREAVIQLTEVVEENPDDADAYLSLGAAYGQLGNLEKALEAVQHSVRLDPSDSKAHYNLAILHVTKGEIDQALTRFRKAVELNPDYSEAHFGLTRILWRHRQCREALPHFAAFLAASPEHVESRINQAICHAEVGEYAEAQALLEAGFQAFPQHPGIQDALIRVLAASDDELVRDGQRAVALAERLASAFARAETLESLAMAYAEAGRFTEARQAQQSAIQAAEQQGLTAWLGHLNANLHRYQQNQPCRTPWEAVIFEK